LFVFFIKSESIVLRFARYLERVRVNGGGLKGTGGGAGRLAAPVMVDPAASVH